jgi:pheromone shutdown-related protein TraB
MQYKNLTIIGTSHIARQSIHEVKEAILREKPQIIAVELDRRRLSALLGRKKQKLKIKDIRKIGIKGFLFGLIGSYVQKKLGSIVRVMPGADMLTAVKLARKKKIKIALIDQDIEITLRRISITFSWKEKFRLLADVFKAIFFRKREMAKLGIKELDLTKVPEKELIKKLTKNLKKRYPNLYKVLIKERNEVMANNLKDLMYQYPQSEILAVVGAGHEEDIVNMLKKEPGISYSFTVK